MKKPEIKMRIKYAILAVLLQEGNEIWDRSTCLFLKLMTPNFTLEE